ncbi:MAG: YbjN domain-containing protein [Alphaproteobacteria bacterium]|nr:YbjN domain-containing protein [Alphaproteobacteria bacterium]MDE2042474.1 YbjN domain-containing protein [Alphaproteobacteria bacterium]
MIDSHSFTPDSEAPIDMLETWFDARGWTNERVSDDEIVAATQGAWGQYELRAVWRDEDQVLQFLAFPDLKRIEGKASALYETLALINEQLWIGHFEMWSGDGTILFRHAMLLDHGDEVLMSLDQAEALTEAAVAELDRFYPVFQFVLWGGKTPSEALSAAMVETHGEA